MQRGSKVKDQVVDGHHGDRGSPGEEVNAARDEKMFPGPLEHQQPFECFQLLWSEHYQ
ncbi:hypothetical protein DPMN_105158 [Dreissena polymorpha]|uniref:Uncharacterized protein n=1 Tax=Dreissena polymorpha TaxID=45954 RepID=A0A9D4H915_DREPO|nr:hypothetical protein DPMN_105158 [Dreissena polymorpha]